MKCQKLIRFVLFYGFVAAKTNLFANPFFCRILEPKSGVGGDQRPPNPDFSGRWPC